MIKTFRVSIYFAFFMLAFFTSQPATADASSDYYEQALTDFAKKDYEAAYIQLKNSLQQNPDNLPAQILMGKVLLISGYLTESEEILEEALTSGADPSLVADSLGKVWLYTKQYEKILTTHFQDLNPQSELDWMLIVATANLNLKKIDGARNGYKKALAIEPNNIKTLNALASLEIQDNNLNLAQQYLDKAFAQSQNNPTSWRLRGDYHLAQGDLEQATQAYDKSFNIAPDDPLIKRSLVTVYMQKQDIPSAQRLLDEVLSQTPSDPTGLLLNAWLLSQREQSDKASKELEKLSANLGNLTQEQLRKDPSLVYVSGLSAFAQQNYQQAKTHFEQYLNFVPNNVDAIALLAQAYIKLGQPKPALEAMQRQERKIAEELDYALILGELYLANNKAFKAVEMIERLKKTYPKEANVDLLEIKALIARGKAEQAMQKLNAHPLGNKSVGFILTKSKLLVQIGEYKQANEIANKLLEISPNNTEFLNLLSAIQLNQGLWDQAEKTVDKILTQNPEHFAARYSKANILIAKKDFQSAEKIAVALDQIRPDNVDVLLLMARAKAGEDDTDDAIKKLERVLEKDIDNLQAMEIKARIHFQRGETEKAIRQYASAVRVAPENPIYRMRRVELLIAANQLERAEREFEDIAQLISDDVVLLAQFSRILLQANDVEGARKSIGQAYNLLPESRTLAIKYMRIHLNTGDIASAQSMLQKWLVKQPKNPELLVLSGDINAKKGLMEQASKDYSTSLEISPNYNLAMAKFYQTTKQGVGITRFEQQLLELLTQQQDNHLARNLLADFYVDQNRFDDALPHYQRLIQVEGLSNRAVILNNMANIFISRDLEKSESLIKQAFEQDADSSAILDTYGWISALKGDYEKALTLLRRAYAMDSDEPSNLYHLAYTLEKLDRKTEARSYAEKALRNGVKFDNKQATQALLDKL